MSLRTAFVWYVLIAAVLATFVCAVVINLLDEYRVSLYFKYQEHSQRIEVPYGGSHNIYVNTDAEEVYVIYDAEGNIVERGAIPYGEGTIEIGVSDDSESYSLFIVPSYSASDTFWNRAVTVLQALTLPICYLGALIICAVLFWRWRLRGPIPNCRRIRRGRR